MIGYERYLRLTGHLLSTRELLFQ